MLVLALPVTRAEQEEKYTVNYSNCKKPTKVKELDLYSACGTDEDDMEEATSYTILTPRRHKKLYGYACTVTRSTFTYYCGAFSHTKILSTPEIERQVYVSDQQCRQMSRSGVYVDAFGASHTITVGATTVFQVNDKGVLHESGGTVSCQGETMKVGNDIVQNILKISEYKVRVDKEIFLKTEDRMDATRAGLQLPKQCKQGDGSCQAWGQAWVWKQKTKCKFVKIRMVSLTREGDYLVDHKNKLIFKKGTRTALPSDCPVGDYYYTEYSTLYLTEEKGEFEPVMELDIALYINSRTDYLKYQNERSLNSVMRQIKMEGCKTNYIHSGHEEEIIRLPGDLFGRRNGDLLYLFRCTSETNEIKDTQTCYNKIPLMNGKFVEPDTRILAKSAAEIDCRTRFPLTVKANEGWIRVGPGIIKRDPPANTTLVEYQATEHEDMSSGGLYNQQELESWENLIEWGSFKSGSIELIANGLCKGSGNCRHYSEGQPAYSLDNLLVKAVKTTNPFTALMDFCQRWGGLLSLTILIIKAAELMVMVVLVVATARTSGRRAAQALLFTLTCGTCVHHRKIRRRTYRLHKETRDGTQTPDEDGYELNERDCKTEI